MKMRVYDYFVMMYYSLDFEYENGDNPSEELRLFLSDLNPFIWAGENSADPAAFEEFKAAYQKYGTDEAQGYYFTKEYIRRECSPVIQQAFSPFTEEDWRTAVEVYLKQTYY